MNAPLPEPLPDWAHEPGLSQVICGCTGEAFTFIVSDYAGRLICDRCHAVNGYFQRTPGQPLVTEQELGTADPTELNIPHTMPPPDMLPGIRDTLHGAAWQAEAVPQPPDPATYHVPDIPPMSQSAPNAYLEGGPPNLDGHLTFAMPDVIDYWIGREHYVRTERIKDGCYTVYTHRPA